VTGAVAFETVCATEPVLDAGVTVVDVAGATAEETAEPTVLTAAWPVATVAGVPDVPVAPDATVEPAAVTGVTTAARALVANEAKRARAARAVAASVRRRNGAFREPDTRADAPIPAGSGRES
jgi:hypothetical protein